MPGERLKKDYFWKGSNHTRLKKNKTEIVDLIVNFRDTTFSFFQQYPQYTCIVYKPLSYDQKVLYDELLNGGWIDQFSLDIQEYNGFKYIYSNAFGSKKKEITKDCISEGYSILSNSKPCRSKLTALPWSSVIQLD